MLQALPWGGLALLALVMGTACVGEDDGGAGAGAGGGGGYCPGNVFVGTISGLDATANVQWSQQPSFTPTSPILGESYIQMVGEITSGQFYYTFIAELYSPTGYGDMVDYVGGTTFRIRIDLIADGFILTANPFGDPAVYQFLCR
jgi:hypothetical protein